MNRSINGILVGFCLLLAPAGLAGQNVAPENLPSTPNQEAKAKPHPMARQKFNPVWWFGNLDDPTPPDSYRPEDRHRKIKWRLRNPLHNFMFYVVGIA